MFTVGQGWPVAGPEKPHMRSHLLPRVAAVLAIGLLAGCGGGGATGTPEDFIPEGMSKVNFGITDAPFPAGHDCLAAAIVEIDEVSLRGKRGWVDLAVDGGTATIDLLQLRSGLADLLATGTVPAGKYNDLRLHVVRAVLVFSDGSPDREFRIARGHSHRIDVKIKPAVTLDLGEDGRPDARHRPERLVQGRRVRVAAPTATTSSPAKAASCSTPASAPTRPRRRRPRRPRSPRPVVVTVAARRHPAALRQHRGVHRGHRARRVGHGGRCRSGVRLPRGLRLRRLRYRTHRSHLLGLGRRRRRRGLLSARARARLWDVYVQGTGANEPTLAVTLTVAACDNLTQDLALP